MGVSGWKGSGSKSVEWKARHLYSVADNIPPCDCNVEGCDQADGATDRAVRKRLQKCLHHEHVPALQDSQTHGRWQVRLRRVCFLVMHLKCLPERSQHFKTRKRMADKALFPGDAFDKSLSERNSLVILQINFCYRGMNHTPWKRSCDEE